MTMLLAIADRVLNRPLLISREKAAIIVSVLDGRIGVDASALAPDASQFVGSDVSADRPRERLPYRKTAEGVAIITIAGTLVNRGAYVGASSGLVSYEGIKHQLASARTDASVKSVILDMASPGGEATGAFETAAAVKALAASKPVVAVVNGMCCSACYAIASAATEIVTTPTGVSGSIGVVLLHTDHSERLAKAGIKPTLIFAGAHKVDGNPTEPLTDAVRADLQAEVDEFYSLFLATVAAGRGSRLTAERARATEGRSYIGNSAVRAGLADRVGSFESVLAELTKATGANSIPDQPVTRNMAGPHSPTPQPAPKIPAEVLEMGRTKGAVLAQEKGLTGAFAATAIEDYAQGFAESYMDTLTKEAARIKAILTSREGKAQEAKAISLAIDFKMEADDAIAVLRNLEPPKKRRENPANALVDIPVSFSATDPWASFRGKTPEEIAQRNVGKTKVRI